MTTIRLIGQGIRQGAEYLPIRHLAGRAAATAPAKDYKAQMKAVYDAITKSWWRYTFDPVGAEVLTVTPKAIFEVTLGSGKPNHSGYADCDDIATAAGALLRSIGFQVIIATTVKPGSPNIFDHVFIFAKSPKTGWICFDPVLYDPVDFPGRGFGDVVPFHRMALWSLGGKLLKKIGPFPPRFDAVMRSFGRCQPRIAKQNITGTETDKTMNQFYDYSDKVAGCGFGEVPVNPRTGAPIINAATVPDFQQYGIAGFGMYNEEMGYTTGDQVPHIMAEVDKGDMIGNTGLVRTQHFEMDPDDYAYMIKNGVPRVGAMALSDTGDVYAWQPAYDGMGGLFKRLARRVKRRVKKVAGSVKHAAKRVRRGVKKFAKRIGKTKVFRLGKRILKTAMKYVKPFLKKFGPKIMQAVSPIAAMIPGAGPLVSTALVMGGKALAIAQKAKVIFDKFGKPIFKSIRQAKNFKGLLKNAAREIGKKGAKQILAKAAAARGIAGVDNDMWKQGITWRTVDAKGFGWV